MTRATELARILMAFFLSATVVAGQQSFPVTSTVNESSIAGRPVELDTQGKLLPWRRTKGNILPGWTTERDILLRRSAKGYVLAWGTAKRELLQGTLLRTGDDDEGRCGVVLTLLKQVEVPGGFDRELYASERVFDVGRSARIHSINEARRGSDHLGDTQGRGCAVSSNALASQKPRTGAIVSHEF